MIKNKTILTPLDALILNEPTQRFILWVISDNPKAFSAEFMIELMKRQDLLQPGKAPNLGKALIIYQNLIKKGMVDIKSPLKTKVSWKGQFYRFHTHPYFQSFGVIAATIIGIIGILASVGIIKAGCTNVKTYQSTSQEDKAQQQAQPIYLGDSSVLQTVGETLDSASLGRNNQKAILPPRQKTIRLK